MSILITLSEITVYLIWTEYFDCTLRISTKAWVTRGILGILLGKCTQFELKNRKSYLIYCNCGEYGGDRQTISIAFYF